MLKLYKRNKFIIFLLPVVILFLLLAARESIPFQEQPGFFRNRGLQLQQQGRLNEAITCYQRAITLDPNFVAVYNDLGIIYEASGWLDKAEEVYLAGIDVDPNYVNLYSNLAMLYEQKQDYVRAAAFWRKRIELGNYDDPWTQKAQLRLEALRRALPQLKQEYLQDEARQLSRELLITRRIEGLKDLSGVRKKNTPREKQPGFFRNRGLQLQQQGRLNEAMTCYRKAIALDPNFVAVYNDLGIIYEASGWLDKAEEVYLAGIDVDPNYVNLYSNLAMLYERKQDYVRAAAFWRKRIELGNYDDPWTQKAQIRLEALRRAFPQLRQRYLQDEARQLSRELSIRRRVERLKGLSSGSSVFQ